MGRTLFDCVGDWFEETLQLQFPDLRRVPNQKGTRPDFTGPACDIEAKTGFWDYGAQLKEAQVASFTPNGKPIVYAIGYHTAAGLRECTRRMNEGDIDAHLRTNAGLHSLYIVSNEIIKKIWRKENHAAKSNPDWRYFSVRPRHLDAIIHNCAFKRGGVRYMPSRWYRISRSRLLLQPAPLLGGRTRNLEIGTILDRASDKSVIDYLRSYGLIHTP